MIEIPIPYKPANKILSVSLDGTRYRLRLRWNARAEYWTLSILTASGENLLSGVPVVMGLDLLFSFRSAIENLPQGHLVCVSMNETTDTPGRYDLGAGRIARLVYEPVV